MDPNQQQIPVSGGNLNNPYIPNIIHQQPLPNLNNNISPTDHNQPTTSNNSQQPNNTIFNINPDNNMQDDDYRKKREKNNVAVRKSRAKAKRRRQELQARLVELAQVRNFEKIMKFQKSCKIQFELGFKFYSCVFVCTICVFFSGEINAIFTTFFAF